MLPTPAAIRTTRVVPNVLNTTSFPTEQDRIWTYLSKCAKKEYIRRLCEKLSIPERGNKTEIAEKLYRGEVNGLSEYALWKMSNKEGESSCRPVMVVVEYVRERAGRADITRAQQLESTSERVNKCERVSV